MTLRERTPEPSGGGGGGSDGGDRDPIPANPATPPAEPETPPVGPETPPAGPDTPPVGPETPPGEQGPLPGEPETPPVGPVPGEEGPLPGTPGGPEEPPEIVVHPYMDMSTGRILYLTKPIIGWALVTGALPEDGETLTVAGDLTLSNVDVGDGSLLTLYRFTDIYQQHYWTPALAG